MHILENINNYLEEHGGSDLSRSEANGCTASEVPRMISKSHMGRS